MELCWLYSRLVFLKVSKNNQYVVCCKDKFDAKVQTFRNTSNSFSDREMARNFVCSCQMGSSENYIKVLIAVA